MCSGIHFDLVDIGITTDIAVEIEIDVDIYTDIGVDIDNDTYAC